MSDQIDAISLGGGVQSSTLERLADEGVIGPKPVASVFGDTHCEPKSVYEWLAFLEKISRQPIIRVSAGDLRKQSLEVRVSRKTNNPYLRVMIPAFTINPDGSRGQFLRTCTDKCKIGPVSAKMKELARGRATIKWMGITTDEAHRMKDSKVAGVTNRYPLAMELRMTRHDCLNWWDKKGLPHPPRSACEFCPYHSDAEWLRLQREEPEGFERSIKYEKALQKAAEKAGLTGKPFLHASRKPLSEVTFDANNHPDLFGNDCSGMCGV